MNENTNNTREIKFEYLRILSMIMIILTHYATHGGLSTINNITTNRIIGNFRSYFIYFNKWIFLSGFKV